MMFCWRNGGGLTLRKMSFVGALAISDLVKTTLGPKGMVRDAGSVFHD